jgi:hypothetical protein
VGVGVGVDEGVTKISFGDLGPNLLCSSCFIRVVMPGGALRLWEVVSVTGVVNTIPVFSDVSFVGDSNAVPGCGTCGVRGVCDSAFFVTTMLNVSLCACVSSAGSFVNPMVSPADCSSSFGPKSVGPKSAVSNCDGALSSAWMSDPGSEIVSE